MNNNNFIEVLIDKLKQLYELYEGYIWKNENVKLNILMCDNSISFYLFDSFIVLDELIISFDDKERRLYEYLCIRYMVWLFGNVVIHSDESTIYNDIHKPYLRLIVTDENIFKKMNEIISMQNNMVVNEGIDMVSQMYKNVSRRSYSTEFLGQFDDRILISKKILSR